MSCFGSSSPPVARVLSREARAALALRMICGLTTEEIARAFLRPEATIAKREVAKASLRPALFPGRLYGRS
jgi:predicted RNA polymerase sigma factor